MKKEVPSKWINMAEKHGEALLAQAKERKWKYIHRVHGKKLQMSYAEIVDWGRWLAKTWAVERGLARPHVGLTKPSMKIETTADGNTLSVESKSSRISTLEELISAAKVDLDVWRVDSYKVNTWESASKIDNEIVVTPLWQVKANLTKIIPDEQDYPAVQPVKIKLGPLAERAHRQSKMKRCFVVPDSQNGYRRDFETGFLDPMHDRLAWDIVVQTAKKLQPHVVVLLGDMLDLADWSDKYVAGPDMYYTTQPTIVELAWWIGQLRKACPKDCEFVYLEGNHEQRMDRAILKHIPSAYGLKSSSGDSIALSVPTLLNLDEMGVDYYDGYPNSEYWLTDTIKFTHGTVVRQGGGKTSSEVVKTSQVTQGFGHIHRLELSSKTVHGRDGARTVYAFSPGTICRLDGVVPGYKKLNDWQQGMAVIHYSEEISDHTIDLIPINEGRAVYDGMVVYGRDRLDDLSRDTGDWFSKGRGR